MRIIFIQIIGLLLLILHATPGRSQQQLHIIPEPASLTISPDNFSFNRSTPIVISNASLRPHADLLNITLQERYGFTANIVVGNNSNSSAGAFVLEEKKSPGGTAGSYTLAATAHRCTISGLPQGVFYGIQTLMQLLPDNNNKLSFPQVTINDAPRFGYRGMHLDVSRHFFPVSFVKKYIDFLAAYKFNRFHWHLTDDQGWRIEIKKYPLLTKVGAWRNGTIIGRYPGTGNDSLHYGGFYTQEEIKEVVKYAASKFIEVIPEIEMPGHSSAAIAAYPQLSCFPQEDTKILPSTPWAGNRTGKQVQQTWGIFEDVFCPTEYTFVFLENVVDEVMALFPSKYIHIGGDECPKENWKRSDFCQQLIASKNLKDEHGLQSYFIQRMEKYINSKGRKIIGWDEILEGGLAPNATVMSWRGETGGIAAAKQYHDVIMTPQGYVYFDHTQNKNEDSVTIGGYTPLEKVYAYEPVPAELNTQQARYILGAQANLWTEYIGSEAKAEYMLFPRMAALAEVLWSPAKKINWDKFEQKIPGIFQSLDRKKVNYSTAYYALEDSLYTNEGKIAWSLRSRSPYTIRTIMDVDKADDRSNGLSPQDYQYYTKPLLFNESGKAKAILWDSSANRIISSIERSFSFNKATAKNITLKDPPAARYAGNGALTLVDGIHNSKGLVRAGEFLGFNGMDIEAVVDLGKMESISEIRLHTFEQTGSWIYRPAMVLFYSSTDGKNYILQETVFNNEEKKHLIYSTRKNMQARYIKIIGKNAGIIAAGLPGAGSNAWVFADEIEVL